MPPPAPNPFGVEGLDRLWRRTVGDPSVRVAVLDGPVDRSHPALGRATIECRETLAPCRAGTGPATRHGTQVASILFGRHGGPIAGLAPGCRGMILPIFADGAGGGRHLCSQADLARAILRALEGRADVINISGGQPFPPGGAHPFLVDAIRRCAERGAAVVAAAGNDGRECLHLPAAIPGVLTVGALDRSGRPLASSNWGTAYRSGGIMAPGEAIPAAAPGGGVEPCTGTSYAAAIVSGVIALALSLLRTLGRVADAPGVAAALIETAEGCRPGGRDDCRRLLAGRMDLDAALELLTRPDPATRGATTQASPPHRSGFPGEKAGPVHAPAPASLAPSRPASPPGRAWVESGSRPGPHQPVYPIGRLSYELAVRLGSGPAPPPGRFERLDRHAWPSPTMVWTLEVDGHPAFALVPAGPLAFEVGRRLARLLADQAGPGGLSAIPGRVAGDLTLPSGLRVPMIRPELRGLRPWSAFPGGIAPDRGSLGVAPGDRAWNFGGPLAGPMLASALERGGRLVAVAVDPSSARAPGKDLWDISWAFSGASGEDLNRRRICRIVVDVGDVIPILEEGPRVVTIG